MVKARRWGIAAATLATLGTSFAAPGCNVGPDFVKPDVALNENWQNADDPRLATGAVDPEWWKKFDDPTLDALIDLASRENLSLQIAGLRILEARGELGVATGEQWPSNAGPAASAAFVRPADHSGSGEQHFGEFQVGFDAVWEIDFWGKFRRGVRAADAEYLATIADYDDVLVSLTAEVARSYVLVRTFETLIDQARQNVALQEEGQRIAQARLDNGATSELDVAQATNLLETTRTSIPKLQIGLQQTQNALSTLLGQPTGFVRSLLLNPRGIPALPALVQVSVPAQLLRRRPDIRAAELRALSQCQRIGVAKADLYPSFVLSGAIGTHAIVGTDTATPLFDPTTLFANVGASVFWPILNYPKIQANIKIEDARYQQSLVVYVTTVLKAAQEVDDGVTGFLREQDAAVFAQNAVESAETAVGLALVQYREGAIDYQRVLDTQRVLLSSQNELVNTRSAAATNLIALYKALGGGWELRVGAPVIDAGTRKEMEERNK